MRTGCVRPGSGNEFGYSAEQLAASETPWGKPEEANPDTLDLLGDFGHGTLDVLGLVPGLGEPADGINAVWYGAEGDTVNAGLSAAGMIPILGWGATGGKFIGKGADALPTGIADDAAKTVNKPDFGGVPPRGQLLLAARLTTYLRVGLHGLLTMARVLSTSVPERPGTQTVSE